MRQRETNRVESALLGSSGSRWQMCIHIRSEPRWRADPGPLLLLPLLRLRQRFSENSGKHFSDLTAGVVLVCGVDDQMIGYFTLLV